MNIADMFPEPSVPKRFEEEASLIAKQLRFDNFEICNGGVDDFHLGPVNASIGKLPLIITSSQDLSGEVYDRNVPHDENYLLKHGT